MSDDILTLNGVDGSTGHYLLPSLSLEEISRLARGEILDSDHLGELRWRHRWATEAAYGPKEGVDPKDLAQAGWGAVFAYDADPKVRQQLRPLLDHRRAQAGRGYREFAEKLGYRPGESKQQFLARHGAGPGPADPDRIPYYLLIVGGPESIPYAFQYQLDVQYAVGRIFFDQLRDYGAYASSVVAAETGSLRRPRRVTLFATRNPDDLATAASAAELAAPLVERLSKDRPDWEIQGLIGQQATKARLAETFGIGEAPMRRQHRGPPPQLPLGTPALLLSATHGVGFPNGDPRQLRGQGALLCQDWPGPGGPEGPLDESWYFSGEDLTAHAQVAGLISFHFACYGAGTPRYDDFAHDQDGTRRQLTPHAFVAALPQRLLSHPSGGALAVIGHVDRAWGYSFMWPQAGRQTQVFEDCLARLMDDHPIGSAFECFNERYAELASDLSVELEEVRYGKRLDRRALAGMWTANNDARDFVILGDPAVRLVAAPKADAPPARDAVAVASPQVAPQPEPEPEPSDVDFGLGLRDGMRQARERLANALQTLTSSLGAVLERAADGVGVFEVATYSSDDLAAARYDKASGRFGGDARLRVLSRTHITGDTQLLVPEELGGIEDALWTLHLGMVEQARAAHSELLKTAGAAVAGLLGATKVW